MSKASGSFFFKFCDLLIIYKLYRQECYFKQNFIQLSLGVCNQYNGAKTKNMKVSCFAFKDDFSL